MLPLTVEIERVGRHRWSVWASTVPAGGSSVELWHRFTREGAMRKARRVVARDAKARRYGGTREAVTP